MMIDRRLDDDELKRIFTRFQAHRLGEVFDNASLRGMNEFMVGVFRSREWTDPALFQTRNDFIQHIKHIKAEPDDHRRLFRAMAEAGNAHAVIAYLHMLGHKNKVLLSDRSALLTTDELTLMVKSKGNQIGSVVHFLSRAAVIGNPDTLSLLPKVLTKAMGNQRDFKYRERFLEGLQSLIMRYGLKNLGIGEHDRDNKRWINAFYTTHDYQTLSLATSVLAAQIATNKLTAKDVVAESRDFTDKVRLVKNLGFKIDDFGATNILSSHQTKQPSFRLDEHLKI